MKKYQYIIALACVLVGAVGFSSIYVTNQSKEREAELARQQQVQESQQLEMASKDNEIAENEEPTLPEFSAKQIADANLNPNIQEQSEQPSAEDEVENGQVAETDEGEIVLYAP